MSDLATLRQRGIPVYCVVDENGIARNGTSTISQIISRGMPAICQVDHNGVATGGSTASQILARGVKAFCQVNESGIDPVSNDTLTQLRARGINPFCVVDTNGIAQGGTSTIQQLSARGIFALCPLDETGTEVTLGVGILLLGSTVPDGSAINTTVGTASIGGTFTGIAVWAISDTDTTFKIDSATGVVQVANATDLVAATHPTITVTITVTGITPAPPPLVTPITVTKAPANTALPTISGLAVRGSTLVSSHGTWAGNPTPALTDQWKSATIAILGQTALTYTVQASDVGNTITITETATNSISSASATSTATATVTQTTLSYTPNTSGVVGTAYTGATPTPSGGATPYAYSLTGSLPTGLSFAPSTGIISGTPTTAATYSGIVLTTTDTNGIAASSSPFSITISASAGTASLDFSIATNSQYTSLLV